LLSILAGCASLPEDVERPVSTAIESPQDTQLATLLLPHFELHPGQSGFAALSDSRRAFRDRVAMIRLAEKSIDVQYYIWDADATGRTFAYELIKAADRGVRVRALIDDSTMSGRDIFLTTFDAHPNIEVRVFNPFANRGSRVWGYLTDLDRLNHRMHNKLIVTDNTMAIVGGRNIADHYFGVNEEANFRDLDILSVGPVVADISISFDTFWNSTWALPVNSLLDDDDAITRQNFRDGVADLQQKLADTPYPYPLDEDIDALLNHIEEVGAALIWANGRVLYDHPDELEDTGATSSVISALREQSNNIDTELLIEEAYFVPMDRGVNKARELVERGIRLRIMTNSLASNDVAAAHAGYEKYRKDLVEAGVEMHELRPDSDEIRRDWSTVALTSKSLLHTKAMVFDRETVFIGSMNLDPRSTDINTEMGMLIPSKELAAIVIDYMDMGASLANSYAVKLNQDDDLTWVTQEPDGSLITLDKEPDTSALKRGAADLIKVLPVESQL